MFEIDLVNKLAGLAPKLYPIVAPLDFETPCVVYNRIETSVQDDLDVTVKDCGWIMVQIDVYDPDYMTSLTLANQIRELLTVWNDANVSGVRLKDERHWIDEETQTHLFRVSQDYDIFYTSLA